MTIKPLLLTLITLSLIGCSPTEKAFRHQTSTPTKTEEILKERNYKPITYLYASQLGKATLDNGEGGGNPFASAFIELLSQKKLDFREFKIKLVDLTLQKSKNFQKPEVISNNSRNWQFLPQKDREKRIALVFVYSSYFNKDITSLQGTKNDLDRISKKLLEVGFKVKTMIDPNKKELDKILKKFSQDSLKADIAVIYTTGHGFEIDGNTYLLPNNYSYPFTKKELLKYSIPINKIGKNMLSTKANLILYGGCRTNILEE